MALSSKYTLFSHNQIEAKLAYAIYMLQKMKLHWLLLWLFFHSNLSDFHF